MQHFGGDSNSNIVFSLFVSVLFLTRMEVAVTGKYQHYMYII